jgi:putative heme-binding domain-containing protein
VVRVLLAVACLAASFPLVYQPSPTAGAQKKGAGKKGAAPAAETAKWIWFGDKARPKQTVFFRKNVKIEADFSTVRLHASCDNAMTVFVDGQKVASSDAWESPVVQDVTKHFKAGKGQYLIGVQARNSDGAAGLVLKLVFEITPRKAIVVVSDDTWRASEKAEQNWKDAGYDDQAWAAARVVGKLGDAPWAIVNTTTFSGALAGKGRTPTATPVEHMKIAKDFRVELLYTVPAGTQGSWVNLCVDPRGRLITSDQYGKLYRVTPPPLGEKATSIIVEDIAVDLGEAQGLLWAFDSLYVVVNRGQKYASGLYRVRDTDGDDHLDKVEKLRDIPGGGEHGPHAILLGPDGKSLYVVAGNHTPLIKTDSSLVPRLWAEDFILPRQWDANGHARGILAPGGWICKTDPEGRKWELVSMGYRNQYDAAFNRAGELFTYDSDMEWDMNTPWYRPTRVCHAVDGSEFGWRSGTGVYPNYYPDNLPPVVDIGPGSPTGMSFGYGAKFPAKYQDALFLCDWSYGKLYAVHLQPDGSSYRGDSEEFITGTPLPLTDVVINPRDGAMYFTIGGRKTMSGLYRVTYAGKESTEPSRDEAAGADTRALRRKLEAHYGKKDSGSIETAWPYLGHADRFLRYAARTILEHQGPSEWQERALKETEPQAALTALLALVRTGDKMFQGRILEALQRLEWTKLSESLKHELLRVYQLAFIRMGTPSETQREEVIRRLDAVYPAPSRELNAELCKLLVFLQAPTAATKTMALMTKAPTQEEQMEYALSLRNLKTGWTKEQRKTYFAWFLKAANYKGGASFTGFVRNIKSEAVALLTDPEKTELKAILEAAPTVENPWQNAKPRPFVKNWNVAELMPALENKLQARDFDRGRQLFGETKCFACHRFSNEGGATGPDLTMVSGRFSPKDLLESIIEPNKVVSDQYQAVTITTLDGRIVNGRIINLHNDNLSVNVDMLNPHALVNVNRKNIDTLTPSKISMMPNGLIDTLHQEEILDLMAYLLSRGDRNHKMFRR